MIFWLANECLQLFLGEDLEEEESSIVPPEAMKTVSIRQVLGSAAHFEQECDLQASPCDLD